MIGSNFYDLRQGPMPIEPQQHAVPEIVATSPIKPPFLKDKTQIENLISLNGISIAEIEERARPNKYSFSGFIGENENFKDVLRKDWETVEKLKVTHTEIAAHLRNIISIAEKAKPAETINIEYRLSDLKGNTIPSNGFQNIEVRLMRTRGIQEDLFLPKDNRYREIDTPKGWNEEYIVKNPSNSVKLNLNSGILSYIHEFGFYEGGDENNKYRVDPIKVMALLTGKSLDEFTNT